MSLTMIARDGIRGSLQNTSLTMNLIMGYGLLGPIVPRLLLQDELVR